MVPQPGSESSDDMQAATRTRTRREIPDADGLGRIRLGTAALRVDCDSSEVRARHCHVGPGNL